MVHNKLVVLVSAMAALCRPAEAFVAPLAAAAAAAACKRREPTPLAAASLGARIPINEAFEGLRRVHSDPDVYVIEGFLDEGSCGDLIDRARTKGASLPWESPVGRSVPGSWSEAMTYPLAPPVHGTSTTITIDEVEGGAGAFVRRAAALFGDDGGSSTPAAAVREAALLFEAPAVIRYEPGQFLSPHHDAKRGSAATEEDANRGGQTLATLLVYLNDVERGGHTRFGKLPAHSADNSGADGGNKLTVEPRLGDALLFFPADAAGTLDERAEHEGCPAVDEKWVARIWRHGDRVPVPFGLSDGELAKL